MSDDLMAEVLSMPKPDPIYVHAPGQADSRLLRIWLGIGRLMLGLPVKATWYSKPVVRRG